MATRFDDMSEYFGYPVDDVFVLGGEQDTAYFATSLFNLLRAKFDNEEVQISTAILALKEQFKCQLIELLRGVVKFIRSCK